MVGVILGANMSNRVLIKRGLSKDLYKAGVIEGELKYATDTNRLYIGNGNENIEIGAGGIINIDSYNDLPEEVIAKPDTLYYCRDIKSYFFVREINGDYIFNAYSCYNNSSLNPTNSSNYQYVTPENKFYKAVYDMDGYHYVMSSSSTPENPSLYEDGTYVVCSGSSKLYQIDSSSSAGYVEISNFVYSYYTQMNPSNAVVGKFFYYRGNDEIYYINAINWEQFQPVIVDTLPKPEKRHLNKYFYYSSLIYICTEVTQGILSWQEIKTDVDLAQVKIEVQEMLSNRLEVVEYSYQQPEASAEAMGKLYMWREYGEYKICVRGNKEVLTIATVTKTESSGSGSGSGLGGLIGLTPVGGGDPYMEGTYANMPQAGNGCNCYYATDLDKYYISKANSGGFSSYYWEEVQMIIQSYEPFADQTEGYYKVVSGNTTTIYQVVTFYNWVNIVEDQHPQVSAQKASGQWDYDLFRLTNFVFDYQERGLSSMNIGYIYGVIEDV